MSFPLLFENLDKSKISIPSMADKAYLEQLASDIQKAVAAYDPNNKGAWVPIQQAAEKIRRAVEPPAVYLTKQNFSVCYHDEIKLFMEPRSAANTIITDSDSSKCMSARSCGDGYHPAISSKPGEEQDCCRISPSIGLQ
jgi:hypothetical protein